MIPQGLESEYLILTSGGELLARGILKSEHKDEVWQMEILDGKIAEVMAHREIQMVPMMDGNPSQQGNILRHRYDNIVVKRIQSLNGEKRQNLRIPTQFASFIYPVTGGWLGRRHLRAKDLSSGGIAFFCREMLMIGEVVEVVIPVTSQPVLLRAEILRSRFEEREDTVMYACKFVGMCHDEEMLVREAVFGIQLSTRTRA